LESGLCRVGSMTVDAIAEADQAALGGTVHVSADGHSKCRPPSRSFADPQSCGVLRCSTPRTPATRPLPEPGAPGPWSGWHELSAADWQKAVFAFL